MEFKIGCQTLVRIEPSGEKIYKDKKKFDTLELAILACKKKNADPNSISKLVSYKCSHCHKYHIGRNGKMVTNKYRDNLRNSLNDGKLTDKQLKLIKTIEIENATFKVVGKIDLSKIPKK